MSCYYLRHPLSAKTLHLWQHKWVAAIKYKIVGALWVNWFVLINASIQIVLTDEEDRTLSELRVATTVPQRTRDRAHMLRLNAQGWTVPAEIFECHEHTVRATLRRWQDKGLGIMGGSDGVQNKMARGWFTNCWTMDWARRSHLQ